MNGIYADGIEPIEEKLRKASMTPGFDQARQSYKKAETLQDEIMEVNRELLRECKTYFSWYYLLQPAVASLVAAAKIMSIYQKYNQSPEDSAKNKLGM